MSNGFSSFDDLSDNSLVEGNDFELLEKVQGETVMIYESNLEMFTCRVWTSLTVVDFEGNSTRLWEGWVSHPDSYDACGGTELTVIRLR
ncbi:hypothetical protein [uncultured Nonlabens sp.]|uniref:hypothetical protein n=1 Tax=uncultured Nonlabens sp. TaxID=859306 RepID=UPI002630C92B|nr:hypothetical protein [uncultured Nonlabens sp.]